MWHDHIPDWQADQIEDLMPLLLAEKVDQQSFARLAKLVENKISRPWRKGINFEQQFDSFKRVLAGLYEAPAESETPPTVADEIDHRRKFCPNGDVTDLGGHPRRYEKGVSCPDPECGMDTIWVWVEHQHVHYYCAMCDKVVEVKMQEHPEVDHSKWRKLWNKILDACLLLNRR